MRAFRRFTPFPLLRDSVPLVDTALTQARLKPHPATRSLSPILSRFCYGTTRDLQSCISNDRRPCCSAPAMRVRESERVAHV